MFISEVEEGISFGFKGINRKLIDESNVGFASIMAKNINEPMDLIYLSLMDEYGILAQTYSIAKSNLERLYLAYSGIMENTELVGVMKI